MRQIIKQFLQKHNIDLHNEKVCIGISTGIDSSVLLHSLLELKEEFNLEIILCHVNHGKREQSNIEEQYIKDYALKNNLIIEILHLDLQDIENDNFQSAARIKRLEFFNEVMNKYNVKYLLLAHHLNDDIETSIMHIIRGSNLKGYAGIDEVVENKNHKIILRPFLTVLKEDIIKYAKENNVKYYEDDSNSSDCYTRNRIRHNVIPNLFLENESFNKQFLEFKDTLLNSYEIVCNVRDEFINNNVIIENEKIIFTLDKFNTLSNFMQIEVLFALLKKYQLSKNNIKEIIKYISSQKPNLLINYKNLVFCKQYNRIIISNQINFNNKNEAVLMEINNLGTYDINNNYYLEVIKYTQEDYKKNKNALINLNVIWYNSSMLPIVLRNKKPGDKIKINSGTKKIKDLLIDAKIPQGERENILLLEKDNEIINVFGVKKSSTLLEMKNNDILIRLREKENGNA